MYKNIYNLDFEFAALKSFASKSQLKILFFNLFFSSKMIVLRFYLQNLKNTVHTVQLHTHSIPYHTVHRGHPVNMNILVQNLSEIWGFVVCNKRRNYLFHIKFSTDQKLVFRGIYFFLSDFHGYNIPNNDISASFQFL